MSDLINLSGSKLAFGRLLTVLAFFTPLYASPAHALSGPPQIAQLPPGTATDIYFEINSSGKLWLRIGNASGPACATLWWIKWPFGNVSQIGKICGSTQLDVPGVFGFSISAKLRAVPESPGTSIALTCDESVAHSLPQITFP
jgi:hypothetical protein